MSKPTKMNAKELMMIQQLSSAFTSIPFNRMLGLQLDNVDADHVVLNFRMKDELVGNYLQGILHGGVISSVLDMAGGMVVMAAALHKNADKSIEDLVNIIGKTSTIDLQINYLSPGRGEVFIAKAYLIKFGSKIAFTRMELMNEQEKLIAMGTATYFLN